LFAVAIISLVGSLVSLKDLEESHCCYTFITLRRVKYFQGSWSSALATASYPQGKAIQELAMKSLINHEELYQQ